MSQAGHKTKQMTSLGNIIIGLLDAFSPPPPPRPSNKLPRHVHLYDLYPYLRLRLSAIVLNLNFHPLKFASRYRVPLYFLGALKKEKLNHRGVDHDTLGLWVTTLSMSYTGDPGKGLDQETLRLWVTTLSMSYTGNPGRGLEQGTLGLWVTALSMSYPRNPKRTRSGNPRALSNRVICELS